MNDGDDVYKLSNEIKPLLAGKPSHIQGAVLDDLFATWVVGHIALGNREATRLYRDALIDSHVANIRELIPLTEKIMGIDKLVEAKQ